MKPNKKEGAPRESERGQREGGERGEREGAERKGQESAPGSKEPAKGDERPDQRDADQEEES